VCTSLLPSLLLLHKSVARARDVQDGRYRDHRGDLILSHALWRTELFPRAKLFLLFCRHSRLHCRPFRSLLLDRRGNHAIGPPQSMLGSGWVTLWKVRCGINREVLARSRTRGRIGSTRVSGFVLCNTLRVVSEPTPSRLTKPGRFTRRGYTRVETPRGIFDFRLNRERFRRRRPLFIDGACNGIKDGGPP